MLVLSLIIMITTRRYICWKMIVFALFWTKMFHLLWPPPPERPLDCRPDKPPPPPSPASRICIFLDFKVSGESSSTEDRATDLKELSTRTDLSSADLEILTASQDFPADSALHTSALITNSGVYGSMRSTLQKCTNSALHKCFDDQQG